MSTLEMTIKGITFTIAAPFAEGHVLDAAQAKALNQTRKENISNSMRKKVEELMAAEGVAEADAIAQATAAVAAYDAEYAFTLTNASGGRRVTDPLEKETLAVAKEYLRGQLSKAGKTAKEMGEAWIDEKLAVLVGNEKIVALAKKRLKERNSLADMEI